MNSNEKISIHDKTAWFPLVSYQQPACSYWERLRADKHSRVDFFSIIYRFLKILYTISTRILSCLNNESYYFKPYLPHKYPYRGIVISPDLMVFLICYYKTILVYVSIKANHDTGNAEIRWGFVSDKTFKKATRCCNNFSCLSTGREGNTPQCRVEARFDENMLLVKAVKKIGCLSCRYKLTISKGNEHICTCPIRYTIYMQNKFWQER